MQPINTIYDKFEPDKLLNNSNFNPEEQLVHLHGEQDTSMKKE